MTDAKQTILWVILFFLAIKVLGLIVFYLGYKRKIRQKVETNGTTICHIAAFHGFLDLASVYKALTCKGYTVSIISPAGQKSDILCLVHHLPFLGYIRDVEIWSE